MARGRGNQVPAPVSQASPTVPTVASHGFEDSAIAEAQISQRAGSGAEHQNQCFDAVEGTDVLSNTFSNYSENAPTLECGEFVAIPIAHSDVKFAHEMVCAAFGVKV
jgi:hypothetical protein